jgi:hypothetical protein
MFFIFVREGWMANLMTTKPIQAIQGLGKYSLAISIYADKLIEQLGGLKSVIKTYGNISNIIRIEVDDYRKKLGLKPLISIVLDCCVFDKGDQSISSIIKTLSLFDQEKINFLSVNPETMNWIKLNKRVVADILSILRMNGVDIIYISDGSNHLMYKCDKQTDKPFNAFNHIKKILSMYSSYINNENNDEDDGYGETHGMKITPGFFGEMKRTLHKG